MQLSRVLLWCLCLPLLAGCARTARDLPLNPDLARTSLETALQAWVDGKKPADLQPEITMGDYAWDAGRKLVSFEIKRAEESSDGTNLYVPVVCRFRDDNGKETSTETVYIVGTSPSITIFPQ